MLKKFSNHIIGAILSVFAIAGTFVFGVGVCFDANAEANKMANKTAAKTDSDSDLNFSQLFPSAQVKKPSGLSHYSANGRGFTISRNHKETLFKFDNSDEVWALSSISGPRGDEFLRNDVGQVMVRITSLGGVTLYADSSSGGVAADKSGKAKDLKSLNQVFKGSLQSAVDIIMLRFNNSNVANIRIEVTGSLPSALVYDALERAADGISNVPSGYFAHKYKVVHLRINRAPSPFVVFQGNVVEIGLTPGISYAGRPSSAAIKSAITGIR